MSMELIETLEIIDVFDHGKPNLERIAIFVHHTCDLSEYCLALGMPAFSGTTTPVRDHLLWFGHGFVNRGDWIIVYTASGSTTIAPANMVAGSSIQPRVISLHWGKEHTIFQNRAVMPLLMRLSGIATLNPPAPAYQGTPEQTKRLL